MPAVSGFEQDFPEKVKAFNIDATTPESKEAVGALGFNNHGLVIRSSAGAVLWKQADHDVNVDDARAALKALVAK
jgi:hypothetical protein